MNSLSNYQNELETIMMSHFEADSIPCEDFTAIYDAWKAKKVLTESEIRASLSSVLEDTSDLPDELMTSIVNFLVARQGKKGGGKGKSEKKPVEKSEKKPAEKSEKKPVEKAEKSEKKPVEKAEKSEKKPETVSVVEEVPVDSVAKMVKKSKAVKAVEVKTDEVKTDEVKAVEVKTDEVKVVLPEPPVRALNAVALFSRIVSLIQKPSPALSGLAAETYTLSDGFKPDSKLYTELKEKGVLSWVGQKKTLGDLITSVTGVLQKPAIISVSAVVRWFLPTADQLKIVAAYQALNLAEPERKVKKRKVGKAAKAMEKAAKVAKPKRAAQGYSLFTQRVGQMMKDPSGAFGDERITLTDSQSEAARATALAKGNPAFATVLASHNLKLGSTYQLRELLGLLKASNGTPTTVVRLSGLLWSMSDASTREKLLAA